MTDLAIVAKKLQEHLSVEYGSTVENKEDSTLMKAVSFGMDIGSNFSSGLPGGADFMTRFATTLAKTIYLPKSIRENPLSLCEVVTHENEHVLQFIDTNVEFAWFYLTDSVARAQFEADAYASGIAVRSWLTGQAPTDSIPWVLDTLVQSYHLKPEDKPYAETALKSHMASIGAGLYMTRSARSAIDFLTKNYPDLKGAVR
jgi:hypothetical protein